MLRGKTECEVSEVCRARMEVVIVENWPSHCEIYQTLTRIIVHQHSVDPKVHLLFDNDDNINERQKN